ncbi:MAG TPA: hypothetical protein PKY05_16720 [Fibrobacteria bacterium]|nr:hypothetical protein [Fibrobacteria bacterium]
MSISSEPLQTRWQAFATYQSERFPFVAHTPLVFAFAFSAASYSRLCRGQPGLPPVLDIALGGTVALGLFFLLRLVDEWKDRHEDARHRPYRPVPRGLVGFGELARWGLITLGIQTLAVLWLGNGLWLWTLPAAVWLGAMSLEFGIGSWLRKHPLTYAASHMAIMPLFDLFSTAIDWHVQGWPPRGVEVFLVLSYGNGFVLEIGRKLRATGQEEPGVDTYSSLYGTRKAALMWLGALALTAATAAWAAWPLPRGNWALGALGLLFPAAALVGIRYALCPLPARAKAVEVASGVWTLGMYLVVGATPAIVSGLGGAP